MPSAKARAPSKRVRNARVPVVVVARAIAKEPLAANATANATASAMARIQRESPAPEYATANAQVRPAHLAPVLARANVVQLARWKRKASAQVNAQAVAA